ncbi:MULTISPECIES: hypothetical protein [unclassified Streptomyces]|uniref:hypothetical protein n=1 Tax=unclassified Streptomyces TaxID=2593676 RepID=UPI00278C78AB|nr:MULTISPECIES: hypothetical protein [unclassified Streptomyces]
MHDHGDDFGPWDTDGNASAPRRTDEEWAAIARYIRHAANKVGPELPLCLPGEPQQCGRTAQQHVLAWAAHLKAAAHHLIERAAPSRERGTHAAGPLYQRQLAELREHSARSHVQQ